jgi:acetyl-CoA acetyltransferase
MLAAAETVAGETGISRRELDELTALRSDQYAKALADDHAFQRRYMVEIQIPQRRKPPVVIDDDEGVRPAVLDDIAALPSAAKDGVHTFATQTHPADGTAGAVVTTVEHARELARAPAWCVSWPPGSPGSPRATCPRRPCRLLWPPWTPRA